MLLPDCIKVPVGHIVKTHGVKGELSVALESDFDTALEPGDALIMECDGLDVPFFIATIRPRGTESILLTLDEVKSEEQASLLCGKTIYVYAPADSDNDNDESDELTADQLVGYTIVDEDTAIGDIEDIREIGPDCWYFVLKGSEKLIPIADEWISYIDQENKIVKMSLPDGLLDLS